MKKIYTQFIIFLGGCILASACTSTEKTTDTDTNNPINSGIGVTFSLDDSQYINDTLVVDDFKVLVDEIEFAAEGVNGEVALNETLQSEVDVITGSANPALPHIALSAGNYSSVSFDVEVWDSGPEGQHAIVLAGTLDGQPIMFEFNSAEVFEASAESLSIPEGEVVQVEFQLNPKAWFNGVDGTSLEVDPDSGVALISETSNAEVFSTVADRLDQTTDAIFPGGTNDEEDTGMEDTGGDTGEVVD